MAPSNFPYASDAGDFQPPTRNPQQAPGSPFLQTGGVQATGQEQLLESGNARIVLPSGTAAPTEPTEVTIAKSGNGVIVTFILLAVMIVIWQMWRSRKISRASSSASRQVSDSSTSISASQSTVTTKKASTKSTQPKRSKKKTKRSRKKR